MHAPVVLLVDDSPTISKVVTHTLRRHGIDVVTATTGAEALAAVRDCAPAISHARHRPPRARWLSGLSHHSPHPSLSASLPIMILSGKDGPIDRMRGRFVGASAYLSKPFEPAELVQIVRAQLGLTGATQMIIDAGSSLIMPIRPQHSARAM